MRLTLWLTGRPASGKTTLARAVTARYAAEEHTILHIDGDELRAHLCADLGFSASDRAENVRRAASVANLLNAQGCDVVVSLISPLQVHRDIARSIVGEGFREVFVDCAPDVCEARDPKGLYARARRGEIPDFTGVSSPYEAPLRPDLHLHTDLLTEVECVRAILGLFVDRPPLIE